MQRTGEDRRLAIKPLLPQAAAAEKVVMTRYSSRPRAPSPPSSSSSSNTNDDDDVYSDNAYSVVQEAASKPKAIKAARNDQRMFGDSVNPSPAGSVLSSSSGSSSSSSSSVSLQQQMRDVSLASLYQARKKGKYDAVTVEEIKAQFQKQIESMLQSQERNNNNKAQPEVAAPVPVQSHPGLRSGHIPSSSERELSGIRDLQRGKSFLEARSAVQKHIERMFSDAASTGGLQHPSMQQQKVKHAMHGVSHAIPGQDGEDIKPPPPVHHGVNQAIKNGLGNKNKNKNRIEEEEEEEEYDEMGGSKWQSVESLLAAEKKSDAMTSELRPSKFRSMENVAQLQRGLSRTVVDIDILGEVDVSDRMRRFKMENGKSLPNISSRTNSNDASSRGGSSSASSEASGLSSVSQQNHKNHGGIPAALGREYVKHKVDYLGSLPIGNRSTNLSSLQRPLKDLYFKYRALRNLGQTNLPGTLEINDTGLRVQYIRELHKGVQEIFNPFPTIAVWAAVKFVHRRDVVSGSVHHQFAFLPLISDPDSQEKHRLFHDLDFHEVELAADAPHPPVFACVMRRTGVPKQLECHGFVCSSSEDAIIVAANLYQALLETMKKQKANEDNRRRRSDADSSVASVSYELTPPPTIFSDSDAAPSVVRPPVRPPRRKKKSKNSSDSSFSGQSSVLQRRRSQRNSVRSNRSTRSRVLPPTVAYDPTRKSTRGLGRTDSTRRSIRSRNDFSRKSVRKSQPNLTTTDPYNMMMSSSNGRDKGDVYTKVAIPRSKSFMNVNSQYNLQELFRELKEKEGVESIDDVLKKIITPNGISFNEIKPVYRELLLKLAMTMSQDELFQRSKNIISQEKKKIRKIKPDKKQKKLEKKIKAKEASAVAKSAGGNGSGEQQQLGGFSGFLKMTFSSSSSKNNSLAGKSKGEKKVSTAAAASASSGSRGANLSVSADDAINSQLSSKKSTSHSSSGYDSGSGKSSMKPLPLIPTSTTTTTNNRLSSQSMKQITKADISGPLPVNGTVSSSGSSSSSRSKTPVLPRSNKLTLLTSNYKEDLVDDAYASCSECGGGYESVCAYDSCSSCRIKIPPPKAYQAGPVHSAANGPFSKVVEVSPATDSEIYCDCDGDSCVSSDKCYCSLRRDPRQTQPKLPHQRPSVLHVCNNNSNKTIIRCNGSGLDTISSVCSSSATSSVTSCSTCIHNLDSGSTATDTTCYSIRHHRGPHLPNAGGSKSSLLSTCDSPQTAWRRNMHQQHSPGSDHSCSDCSNVGKRKALPPHPPLARRNSGGSGYHSNDSCSSPHHGQRDRSPQETTCSNSSCSNSSSGYGVVPSNAMRRANSKVLLLSAVDKSGKVMYRGASNSNSNTVNSHRSSSQHSADEKSLLSMKKSAEIAAVFSGAKISQTTDIVDHLGPDNNHGSDGDDADSTDDAYDSKRSNCHCNRQKGKFSRSNMQSSLGYFP